MIQQRLALWSLVPLSFLNPAWTFGSSLTVHVLLKPGLENFEHYFASMWDECNCAVVWAFFGIAFLRDWNENWPFPVCGHYWFSKFAGILSVALSQHHLLGFEILNCNSITSFSFVGSDASWCPLDFLFQDIWLKVSDHTIVIIWVMKILFV